MTTTPSPPECCCSYGHQAHNGMLYTNAGCKLHGLYSLVLDRNPYTNPPAPATSILYTNGWHRIAEGE